MGPYQCKTYITDAIIKLRAASPEIRNVKTTAAAFRGLPGCGETMDCGRERSCSTRCNPHAGSFLRRTSLPRLLALNEDIWKTHVSKAWLFLTFGFTKKMKQNRQQIKKVIGCSQHSAEIKHISMNKYVSSGRWSPEPVSMSDTGCFALIY